MGVVLLQEGRSQPKHFAVQDPQPLLFKPAQHLPGQALGHGIGLHQNQGNFGLHLFNLNFFLIFQGVKGSGRLPFTRPAGNPLFYPIQHLLGLGQRLRIVEVAPFLEGKNLFKGLFRPLEIPLPGQMISIGEMGIFRIRPHLQSLKIKRLSLRKFALQVQHGGPTDVHGVILGTSLLPFRIPKDGLIP